jgi:hypothetical protein
MKQRNAVRNARLKAAQLRWAREDRERGFPVRHRRISCMERKNQQLNEDLLVVAALAFVCVWVELAG